MLAGHALPEEYATTGDVTARRATMARLVSSRTALLVQTGKTVLATECVTSLVPLLVLALVVLGGPVLIAALWLAPLVARNAESVSMASAHATKVGWDLVARRKVVHLPTERCALATGLAPMGHVPAMFTRMPDKILLVAILVNKHATSHFVELIRISRLGVVAQVSARTSDANASLAFTVNIAGKKPAPTCAMQKRVMENVMATVVVCAPTAMKARRARKVTATQ